MTVLAGGHLLQLPDELLLNVVQHLGCPDICAWRRTCRRLHRVGRDRARCLRTLHRRTHKWNDRKSDHVIATLKRLAEQHPDTECIRSLSYEYGRGTWPSNPADSGSENFDPVAYFRNDHDSVECLYDEHYDFIIQVLQTSFDIDIYDSFDDDHYYDEEDDHYDGASEDDDPWGEDDDHHDDHDDDDKISILDEIEQGKDRFVKLVCIASAPYLRRLCFTRPKTEPLLDLFAHVVHKISLSDELLWPPGFQFLREISISGTWQYWWIPERRLLTLLELPDLRSLTLEVLSWTNYDDLSSEGTSYAQPYALEQLSLSDALPRPELLRKVFERAHRLRFLNIMQTFETCLPYLPVIPLGSSRTSLQICLDWLWNGDTYCRWASRHPSHQSQAWYCRRLLDLNPINTSLHLKTVKNFPAAVISQHFDRLATYHLSNRHYRHRRDKKQGLRRRPERYEEYMGVVDLQEILPVCLESLHLQTHYEQSSYKGSRSYTHFAFLASDDIPYLQALARRLCEFVQAGSKLREVVLNEAFNKAKLSAYWQKRLDDAGIALKRNADER